MIHYSRLNTGMQSEIKVGRHYKVGRHQSIDQTLYRQEDKIKAGIHHTSRQTYYKYSDIFRVQQKKIRVGRYNTSRQTADRQADIAQLRRHYSDRQTSHCTDRQTPYRQADIVLAARYHRQEDIIQFVKHQTVADKKSIFQFFVFLQISLNCTVSRHFAPFHFISFRENFFL